jgi:hypothetical protein
VLIHITQRGGQGGQALVGQHSTGRVQLQEGGKVVEGVCRAVKRLWVSPLGPATAGQEGTNLVISIPMEEGIWHRDARHYKRSGLSCSR